MAEELGVLILGAGRVSNNHATAIAATPGARLAGIFDIDEARVEAFEAKHGCPGFTNMERALQEIRERGTTRHIIEQSMVGWSRFNEIVGLPAVQACDERYSA